MSHENSECMSETVHKPMILISTGILVSRILGLVRDIVLASIWGTGAAMGGWIFAFTIPNLLRALFAEGAFSSAFVPIFSERLETEGRVAAWRSATVIIGSLLVVVSLVVALIVGISFPLRSVVSNPTYRIALDLLPIIMPYAILIAAGTALGAALNTLGRFGVPAFSPLLLNLFLIGGAILVSPWFGETPEQRIRVLPLAALAAGVGQVLLHGVRCSQLGCRFRPRMERRHADTRRVARLMAPVMIGVGVMQLNILLDRLLAGWLGSEAITSLYYSQRLVYLPVGLFGVALGVVSLPMLSRAWAAGKLDEMADHLRAALGQVVFLAVPAALGLLVVRTPLVSLLFQRGAFDAADTGETVYALLFYLPGIPAFACAKVAVTPFHAAQDTRTPVRVAVICLVLNLVLNLSLMPFLRQGGLALATSIASWVNVLILLHLARRTMEKAAFTGFGTHVARIVSAGIAGVAAAVAVSAAFGLDALPEGAVFGTRLVHTLVPLAVLGAVYTGTSLVLGCRDPVDLLRAIRGR
ncbi:MAG: murein biosynthesis integral membrane protein MurJ [Verrucomicrobiota bacterium]